MRDFESVERRLDEEADVAKRMVINVLNRLNLDELNLYMNFWHFLALSNVYVQIIHEEDAGH